MGDNGVQNIILLFCNMFYALIVENFYRAFFYNCKRSDACLKIAYVVYPFAISMTYITFNNPTKTLISTAVITFLLTFCYKSDIKNQLLAATFITIIAVVSELSIGYFLSVLVGVGITETLNQSYYKILIIVVSKLLFHVLTQICLRIIRKKKWLYTYTPYWLAILSVPISSTVVLYYLFALSKGSSDNGITIFICTIAIILINIIIFFVYDKTVEHYRIKTENDLLNKQIEYYAYQNREVLAHYNSMKEIRHDMNNYLICFNGFLADGDVIKAKEFIQATLKTFPSVKLVNSGNVGIDALLNYKNSFAISCGAKLDIQLDIPSNLAIKMVDISVILGNTITNAIEAVSLVTGQDKLIKIYICYNKGNLFITVSNPYSIPPSEMTTGELATSKLDKAHHGIGLKSVKKVVEKYNGDMLIDTQNQTFTLQILLYDIEKCEVTYA